MYTFMNNDHSLAVFEDYQIRRVYNEDTGVWYFSVVDIVQALIQQPDYQTARKYWNKLKERLKYEGSQTVTNCHQLKERSRTDLYRPCRAVHPSNSGDHEGRRDERKQGCR